MRPSENGLLRLVADFAFASRQQVSDIAFVTPQHQEGDGGNGLVLEFGAGRQGEEGGEEKRGFF